MKRFLSLILTLTLMISAFSTLGIVAHATVTEPSTESSTEPAIISDVALIVDGIEYINETATIYSTSVVRVKLYGENLQNATRDNKVMYKRNHSLPMGIDYQFQWQIDESGTFAISTNSLNYLNASDFTLRFTNDGDTTWQTSNTSFVYGGVKDCFGNHFDVDEFKNICDSCKEYLGPQNLVLGENEVEVNMSEYSYVRFVPDETCIYRIYSISEGDPIMKLFTSDLSIVDSADDYKGNLNFNFFTNLDADETYYLGFRDYHINGSITVGIEKHEHTDISEAEHTCMGYYCTVCNWFFGEPGDHDQSSEQTCVGYYCDWCDNYYGENNDNHDISEEQTCLGYQCNLCDTYFGEGSDLHIDEDSDVNLCDVCSIYLGDGKSLVLGENAISGKHSESIFIPFVPTKDGIYNIYSNGDCDPMLKVYDADMKYIDANDDYAEDYNFNLYVQLYAGQTYYLSFFNHDADSDYITTIELHIHDFDALEQDCRGYYCPECDDYFGESDGNHIDDLYYYKDGHCDICGYVFTSSELIVGKNTVDTFESTFKYVTFTPSVSGKYLFYSVNALDSYINFYIMSGDGSLYDIAYADDENPVTVYDFVLDIELEAGVTYFIQMSTYKDERETQYDVYVEIHNECEETFVTCSGTFCEDCYKHVSDVTDEDVHYWAYGDCFFCEMEFSDDNHTEHTWVVGNCRICGMPHNCQNEHFGASDNCVVCGEYAGCAIIRNGDTVYYEGFTEALAAAVDGDTIIFFENRYFTKIYDIYKNITIDLNGHYWRAENDGEINVYSNVTFTDSKGYGAYWTKINVYEKANLNVGQYNQISLYNDLTYSDIIFGCLYVNAYDYEDDTFVNLSPADMDEREFRGSFTIIHDDPRHVACDWEILKEATCTENAEGVKTCIHCDLVLETRVIEDTATGHHFSGNHGEGTKTCDDCHIIVEDEIYSGEAARDFVREAYDFLKNFVVDMVDEYILN